VRVRALIALFAILGRLAARVPHTAAVRLCAVGGTLWYFSSPTARAAVIDNLRHILHRPPTSSEVRAVFMCGALNYWDIFSLPYLSRAELLRLIEIQGLENVDQALTNGHGAILVTCHLASVSLVGQVLPALGYRLSGLLEPIEPPELLDFFVAQREAFGARLLPATPYALRELVAALRRNEVLGLVTDRDINGTGPVIPFFGAPTTFADGPAALSVRTGAPILAAIARLRPDGRFDGIFEPPITIERSGDPKQDVLLLTRAVAERLEYHIASHPQQWTVFQKRWPDAQSG